MLNERDKNSVISTDAFIVFLGTYSVGAELGVLLILIKCAESKPVSVVNEKACYERENFPTHRVYGTNIGV